MNAKYDQFTLGLPHIMESLEKFYMVTHMDEDGAITYTNKLFLQTSKWTPKRVLGKTFWQMFPAVEDNQQQAQKIWTYVMNGNTWSSTVEKVTRHGESYFVNMIAIPLFFADSVKSVIFFEVDVTEDIRLRDRLEKIASIDYETGLMSRYTLETTIHSFIEDNIGFSFVYITIDHFYKLKDLQSHLSENELVKSFSNRLKRFFKDDSIARIGANEFVILTSFANWYVQGFLDFLKQQPIIIENTTIPLSVSGVIIRYPEDQKTYTQLMTTALTATEKVSNTGGGKITTLSRSIHKEFNRKAMIERKLHNALNDRKLQVFYQPQIDMKTETVLVYEAFVRWQDEELGTISPDELIPIAEENGLIHKIGAFVLEEAAHLAARWKAEGRTLEISVNSSVREFTNSLLKDEIIHTLETAGCPPDLLQLEITETFAFQAEEESSISRQMQALQEKGIDFVLDDFGTGYASFRYMHALPINIIKIDKLFIQAVTTQPKTKQLVQSLIQFGKSMGLYVVAEGVETKEQFDLLRTMGIDAVQGYYIGIPTTAENLILT